MLKSDFKKNWSLKGQKPSPKVPLNIPLPNGMEKTSTHCFFLIKAKTEIPEVPFVLFLPHFMVQWKNGSFFEM